ncbi:MAG TPA: thiamine pyrophosphate-dependent enzyme [Deltaproteobacteria bacterium]|nr:thiamine pyrophosphate-dependent enzyme [Deltaproteobacteria bacterium]HOS27736.1 thiamine pyrophosphate-dependent enzyme [Deltaproteobacteria bacterium]HPL86255.1 thiamine pyrophosphate-dependent enzyme [Deltaproteobacteria bacterium]HQO82253.1 thiamine pyrophosphate-dependent enzyme [Deltaproteobacteria bacterium]
MGVYDFEHAIDIAWCPGCGNFRILKSVKDALEELELDPRMVVFVSGIGQAAKTPQYMDVHYFNGLHGRTLPAATAIKASNRGLVVIAESGDGDMYGEGGNHFMHAIRRNPDITNIVHNNMVYALTKGQASPTTRQGFVTPVQTQGVTEEPFNPIAVAIALDASFVARAFAGDARQTTDIIKKAVTHKGYALVDIFQPCVTYNKVNTYAWFKENTYYLDDTHDPSDREAAFRKATEPGRFPLGVIYLNRNKSVFEETLIAYRHDDRPLYQWTVDMGVLKNLVDSMRT